MTREPLGEDHRTLDVSIAPQAPQRAAVIQELGLSTEPDPEWNEFARGFAEKAQRLIGAERPPITLVNLVTDMQYFTGMYVSPDHPAFGAVPPVMPDDHGGCPHVIARGKALVLDDVCDYPRFAGNIVVDKYAIRTYVGAPLIHRGTPFGTICLIDQEPAPWGGPALHLVKDEAESLMARIHRRAGMPT